MLVTACATIAPAVATAQTNEVLPSPLNLGDGIRLVASGETEIKAAIDPAVAGYTSGQLPLVSVIEAVQALWLVQADLSMADTELGLAWAHLGRAVGPTRRCSNDCCSSTPTVRCSLSADHRIQRISERDIARVSGQPGSHLARHIGVADAKCRVGKAERAAGSRRSK